VAAPERRLESPSSPEIREIIATLLVERSALLKAGEVHAAAAIGLAIQYWEAALARLGAEP
jgi:hypothetical protein